MGYGRPFYKKPIFYIALALLAALIAGVIIVVSIVSQKNNEAEEAERIKTESDEYWADYVDQGGYSETIRELLEGDYKTDLSGATWEYALCDLDLDGRDELFLRINGKNEDNTLTFVICLVDGDPSVAGVYKGGSYPVFSEEYRTFECPATGEVLTDHSFFRLEDGKCVLAYRLYEDGGEYKIKRDGVTSEIPSEEYGKYFSDCVFLDWTHFYSRFTFTPNYWSSYPETPILEAVGEVPEDFKRIVDENLFEGATYMNGRVVAINQEYYVEYSVEKSIAASLTAYDIYGRESAHAEFKNPPVEGCDWSITMLEDCIVTSDGGFAVLSLVVSYRKDERGIYNDSACSLHLSKLGYGGNVEWETVLMNDLMVSGAALIEGDGGQLFAFVSSYEEEDAEIYYEEVERDLNAYKVSDRGEILAETVIGSSGDNMSIASAKRNGDGKYSVYYLTYSLADMFSSSLNFTYTLVTLDGEDMSYEIEEDVEFDAKRVIGTLDGEEIYYDNARIVTLMESGVTLVLDYGDFFLVVSNYSFTSLYSSSSLSSKMPVSTAYSAYSKDGELLWRAYGKSK